MKLSHLTFGQLWKLAQPETLTEVLRGYHAFLRSEVPDARAENGIFSYGLAEASLEPYVTICWRQKIALLTGGELKKALRTAAEKQVIAPMPGYPHPFMVINRFKFPNYRARLAVAGLILMHCRQNGVPATMEATAREDFEIITECGPVGQALLRYKPGLTRLTIQNFCTDMKVPFCIAFPWVPTSTGPHTRINPCVWPTNTPDVNEIAKELM